jgi:hypothetical protein
VSVVGQYYGYTRFAVPPKAPMTIPAPAGLALQVIGVIRHLNDFASLS